MSITFRFVNVLKVEGAYSSCETPSDCLLKYNPDMFFMTVLCACVGAVWIVVFRDVWRAALISGLYYLYGAPVLSVWLWDPCRVFSVSSAQHCGKAYEVCSHLSHALHAGHVQQRYQGASYLSTLYILHCFFLLKVIPHPRFPHFHKKCWVLSLNLSGGFSV